MSVEEEQSSSTHGVVPEPQRFSGHNAQAAQDVIVEMQPITRPKRIIRQQVYIIVAFVELCHVLYTR